MVSLEVKMLFVELQSAPILNLQFTMVNLRCLNQQINNAPLHKGMRAREQEIAN